MAARRSWKGLVLNVLLSLVAFGLLGWTVWSNRAKLGEVRARNPDLRLFVAAVGLYVGALLVTFLRWHRLVLAKADIHFLVGDWRIRGESERRSSAPPRCMGACSKSAGKVDVLHRVECRDVLLNQFPETPSTTRCNRAVAVKFRRSVRSTRTR